MMLATDGPPLRRECHRAASQIIGAVASMAHGYAHATLPSAGLPGVIAA
jgi:hypothetical protein